MTMISEGGIFTLYEYVHENDLTYFHVVLFPESKIWFTMSYFIINPPREGRQVAEGCAVGGWQFTLDD